jgi:sugar (pentulose or hexulose) kinase
MIAAVQRGIYPDMAACAAVWTAPRLGPALSPDPALAAIYHRLFPIYREAVHTLPPLWRHMHDVRETMHAD